jgi:hypothetical protein
MSVSADYTPPESSANDMICASHSSGDGLVSSPFRDGWTAFGACVLRGQVIPMRAAAPALHVDERDDRLRPRAATL